MNTPNESNPGAVIHKAGMKLMVLIVNREDTDKAVTTVRSHNFHFMYTCLAEGTVGAKMLDLFGFGSTDKALILCVAPGQRVRHQLPLIAASLQLEKRNKGIAFTIPISGLTMPHRFDLDEEHRRKWEDMMEKEVDQMDSGFEHGLILAIVNKGYSEELVERAKEVGARGGTIINARRCGAEEAVKFFGIPIQSEKEIVAILAKKETKHDIMATISSEFGVKSDAHGIVLSLPVDSVAGIE